MAYGDGDSSLRGVGGWMYLFLFGFAFGGPLRMVFGTAAALYGDPNVALAIGDRWTLYQAAVWTLIAAGLAVIALVVWRLFNVQNPKTVLITIIAIPGLGFGLPFFDWLLAVLIIGAEPGALFNELAPDLIRVTIYCAIWCSYFKVSKRVYNTYLAPQEDETLAVFQ